MWRGKETLEFRTWSVVLVLSTILKGIKFPPHKDHLKTLTTALRAATGRNFGRSKSAMGRDVNNEVFRRGAKGMGMVSTATWLVVLSNGMDLKEIRLRTSLLRTLGSSRQLRFWVPGDTPWRARRGRQGVRQQELLHCRLRGQPREKATMARMMASMAMERAKEATTRANKARWMVSLTKKERALARCLNVVGWQC